MRLHGGVGEFRLERTAGGLTRGYETTITLQENILCTGAGATNLRIPAGRSITLDLNGYALNRNCSGPVGGGGVLYVEGALTLKDSSAKKTGMITGGHTNDNGGGVYVRPGATFTMYGGTISGNRASHSGWSSSNGFGARVYLEDSGKFNMYGGAIISNHSDTYDAPSKSNDHPAGGISYSAMYSTGRKPVSISGYVRLAGNTCKGFKMDFNTDGNYTRVFAVVGKLHSNSELYVGCKNVLNVGQTLMAVTNLAGNGLPSNFPCDNDENIVVLTKPGDGAITRKQDFGTAGFSLPSALTAVEAEAFEGLPMTSLYVPDNCTSIGASAFKGCASLTRVRLPKDCTIDDSAFDGCGKIWFFVPEGGTAWQWADDYVRTHDCVIYPVD